MPRLFLLSAIALTSLGLFLAAKSPAGHLLAITAFAIVLSRMPSRYRWATTLSAIFPFLLRAAFDFTGHVLTIDDVWVASAGEATLLHQSLTVLCMSTLFVATTNSSRSFGTLRFFSQPIITRTPLRLEGARNDPSPSPAPNAPLNAETTNSDGLEFEFDLQPNISPRTQQRTTSDQKTLFIFPLTASKSAHLVYDFDPDDVLDELLERLSFDEAVELLVKAECFLPDDVSSFMETGASASECFEALIGRGVLTRYQAMLVAGGFGDLLNIGPYQVLERIGRGGMALVLRVRDRTTKHIYALKLLVEIESLNDALRNRFLREMDAVRKLAHPNIAVARTVGQHNHFLYIAMEWVQGQNLAEYVHQNGPLPPAVAIRYIRQASEALRYAHQRGLVHRDVKPANLILGPSDEIKLVDMGLARFVDALEQHTESQSNHWKTDTGQLMGTIDYMAPEQAVDLGLADHRSDIYSLGCTLFYLLTGETHLRGSTQRRRAVSLVNKTGMRDLREVREGLAPCIYSLVTKMIQISPKDRFQSIGELLRAIDQCAVQFGLPAQPDKAYRVLVVEDSLSQALLTCEQLKATSQHFIPIDVNTLSSACERLLTDAFDIVLLDLNLPDSRGIDTIKRLRMANETVPILVLTSSSDLAMGVQCIDAGADDFLPKDSLDVLTLERHILLTMSRRDVPAL